ncbi:MAG TPA: hypothetical protein VMU34_24795 [Mycobacterium sp.]|nr:hypothetical protein [Mycobacterium sp.]
MTDDEVLEELRECIELVGDAERQSGRLGEKDVHLSSDGAHRLIAALAMAADMIGQR